MTDTATIPAAMIFGKTPHLLDCIIFAPNSSIFPHYTYRSLGYQAISAYE